MMGGITFLCWFYESKWQMFIQIEHSKNAFFMKQEGETPPTDYIEYKKRKGDNSLTTHG
jgi:hypothetical protein